MAIVSPFCGIRYAAAAVPDLSAVIAPPYDVISPSECETLYRKHPHNVARLILGKEGLANHEKTNFYQTAADAYRDWRRRGVLKADAQPSLYLVQQTFEALGGSYTRRGFMARVLLEEFGKGSVHPHEQTISAPKADRLRLMRAARANFSPIFGLFPDPGARVSSLLNDAARRPPDATATDWAGDEVKLWRLDDAGLCAAVADLMRRLPIFIADGHHRYETALTFRNETRTGDRAPLGDRPCDWIMMTCVAMDDPGLVILPTHRVVRKDAKAADVSKKIADNFTIREEPAGLRSALQWMAETNTGHRFAMYGGENDKCSRLELRPDADLAAAMPGRSAAWRRLDVSILHYLIIERALGIPFDTLSSARDIEYFKDAEKAADAVRGLPGGFALFLNATPISALQAVAEAREKMPPKSTYFYPKLATGLVINPLE